MCVAGDFFFSRLPFHTQKNPPPTKPTTHNNNPNNHHNPPKQQQVNKFKFRQDVQAYHLGGMGCGNGVIAIGLVRDLLQAHPNATVVFVPCEITTYAYYTGFHARYCVANCIFRMGAAAAVVSLFFFVLSCPAAVRALAFKNSCVSQKY